MAVTSLAVAVGSTLAQETYLAKVGPPPLRFLIPRTGLPSITLFGDSRSKSAASVSNEVASAQAPTTTPAINEPESFVGPLPLLPTPGPTLPDEKASTLTVNSGSQAVSPSEIKLAGASGAEPVTAQMMVRYFRTPPPLTMAPTTGASTPHEGGVHPAGSETAVFVPIQFQPPEPLGGQTRGSSASYEVTPKSSEVIEAGQKESKQPAVHP